MSDGAVVVIGAGGHARVLIEALQLAGRSILGAIDPALPSGSMSGGIKVLGGDETLEHLNPVDVVLVNGIGGTQTTAPRDAIYRRWRGKGFHFATVVHPSAVISPSATLGEGAQVMAGCVIQSGASIGANSIINTRASVDHDCKVGETVHVAPGVTLSGSVNVGDGSHIGTGAAVIQGVSIGRNTLIAAGSVVYRDVPDNARHVESA